MDKRWWIAVGFVAVACSFGWGFMLAALSSSLAFALMLGVRGVRPVTPAMRDKAIGHRTRRFGGYWMGPLGDAMIVTNAILWLPIFGSAVPHAAIFGYGLLVTILFMQWHNMTIARRADRLYLLRRMRAQRRRSR